MLILKDNSVFSFFVALSLFLPSTVLMPSFSYYLYAPVFILILLLNGGEIKKPYFITLLFFIMSLLLSITAFLISGESVKYFGNFIPVQLGLIASLICSMFINKKVAKFLICILIFEFIISCLQYYSGVSTFFPSSLVTSSLSFDVDSDLLYRKRVFGFNNNSSGLAGNALICFALMLSFFTNEAIKRKVLLGFLIFIVLIMAFSRSGIVAFFSYFLLFYIIKLFDVKKILLVLFFSLCAFFIFQSVFDIDFLFSQFTRDRNEIDLTGRSLIWSVYWEAIKEAPIFGNFGFKNYLSVPVYGYMHAHNSLIMSLYVFGLIPLLIILIPIVFEVIKKPKVILFLTPIVVFSLAQTFLLWGGSFADVIFFAVIFNSIANKNNSLEYQDIKGR